MRDTIRAGDQSHVWPLPVEGCASNDWAAYQARLAPLLARRGLQRTVLGDVGDAPVWLLQPGVTAAGPRLLIAAGFHGEEPAGPWGLLRFLEQADDSLFARARLSFLPLVNVSGFAAGCRFNRWGENPNRGFCITEDGETPSREGHILLEHAPLLAQLGSDGVLSCHEDVLVQYGYVYSFEHAAAPGPFSHALRDCNARFFTLMPDGEVDGCPVRHGVVFNHRDSSFESWMMQAGVARAACTETPGQQAMETRVAANAAMMATFVEYALAAQAAVQT
ncbi:hypothetical protein IGB42_00907 [Andreprevotia sp. IGB-42]|uniref:M14 family metallopeptidase n=1 Tax=Andreprevotia sp. IGB-42 TaxID=2497473 RepID=UPI00135C030F|nr:M14 family metallocarboxypeptidase [Andreprevotia sp. IGB-42]KAF0814852.1 hypothetical protein IGB42_00907 [Andreprevotia sp. IGB-42]